MLLNYVWLCFKKSFDGFSKFRVSVKGLTETVIGTSIATALINKSHKIVPFFNYKILASSYLPLALGLLSWLILAWVFRLLFYAPYCLWDNRRLDDPDLNHLLGGKFIGNRFYPSCPDLILCIINNEDIKNLKNKFLEIKVHAPQNCFAYVKFHFSRDRGPPGFRFYTINEHGKEVEIERLSANQKIFVNKDFKFSIKLTCDPDYNIEEHVTSLTVFMFGWVKI